MSSDIITKLQSPRGYQGQRIRLHPFDQTVWLAEVYTFIGRGNKKGWTALRDPKKREFRTFKTPELAYQALETLQKEIDDLEEKYR